MNRRNFLMHSAAAAAVLTHQQVRAQDSKTTKKYRACIIGDSLQGKYGHGLHMAWGLRDEVEVVALADPDEAGREKHAKESGALRQYSDYREMLEKESPDLVTIGPRWTNKHREYLLACAAIGAHGFIEKPLTPDLAEADEVVAGMTAKNLKWAIAFNFRTDPVIAHAKKMLFEEKLIGDILEIRGRGKEDVRSGGEDLIVLGIHLFDMMIYFLGKPSWCAARILTDGRLSTRQDITLPQKELLGPIVGDSLHAVYGFKGEIPGYFASTKVNEKNPGRYGMDIYGSKGMATIRIDPRPTVYYTLSPSWVSGGGAAEWTPLPDAPTVPLRRPEIVSDYAPIIDDLMAAIAEDRQPQVSIEDGRQATEMIQAVFDAHFNGGYVDMPLKQRSHPLI
ncbi:MAG: Gfo/Idh/MocA family oxidoreductase [Candidatus Hydrogenedentes bacterium]|jgi:predicted dehydrogenase|nr:Gfo/Idh/MocA family oxidoreductase [Candidatus Hydrogenedentota bacterium]